MSYTDVKKVIRRIPAQTAEEYEWGLQFEEVEEPISESELELQTKYDLVVKLFLLCFVTIIYLLAIMH